MDVAVYVLVAEDRRVAAEPKLLTQVEQRLTVISSDTQLIGSKHHTRVASQVRRPNEPRQGDLSVLTPKVEVAAAHEQTYRSLILQLVSTISPHLSNLLRRTFASTYAKVRRKKHT